MYQVQLDNIIYRIKSNYQFLYRLLHIKLSKEEIAISSKVNSILLQLKTMFMKLFSIHRFLKETITLYIKVENSIKDKIKNDFLVFKNFTTQSNNFYFQSFNKTHILHNNLLHKKAIVLKHQYNSYKDKWNFFTISSSNLSNLQLSNLPEIIRNKIIILGKDVNVSVLSNSSFKPINNSYIMHSVDIGNLYFKGFSKNKLSKEEHSYKLSSDAEVGVSVSFLKGSALYYHSNESFEYGMNGSLLNVTASKKFDINKNEFVAKGEVGASIGKGNVYAKFKLFNIHVKVEAEGHVGGFDVGAHVELSKKKIQFGGKLSCLIGGGLNFEITW